MQLSEVQVLLTECKSRIECMGKKTGDGNANGGGAVSPISKFNSIQIAGIVSLHMVGFLVALFLFLRIIYLRTGNACDTQNCDGKKRGL